MKSIIRTLAVAVSALLLLPSCNSQHITMKQYLPGVMDVNINHPISVYGYGSKESTLASAIESEWRSRGGTTMYNGKPYLSVRVSGAGYRSSYVDQNGGTFEGWATIEYNMYRNGFAWKTKEYGTRTFVDRYESIWGKLSPRLASRIVTDVLPGYRTRHYYVNVDKKKNLELYNAAVACKRGQWTIGAALLKTAIATHPSDPEVWYLAGLIDRHDGRFAESEANFRKASSIKPSKKYTNAITENHSWTTNHNAAMRQYQL